MRDSIHRGTRQRGALTWLHGICVLLLFFFLFACILCFLGEYRDDNGGVILLDRALDLSGATRTILMLNSSLQVPYRLDNPWRTARRGCGGHVRPSIRRDSLVTFRYAIWDSAGALQDTSSSPVQMRVGSGQDSEFFGRPSSRRRRHGHSLYGLCSGDIVQVTAGASYSYNNNKNYGSKMILILSIMDVSNRNMNENSNANVGYHTDYLKADALALVTRPVRASRRRLSCLSACRRRGLVCSEKAFVVVNDCDVLRRSFNCTAGCEVAPVGAAGADMPCYVSPNAPRPFRKNLCLVAPNPASSRCAALHQHTIRLCPCVAG